MAKMGDSADKKSWLHEHKKTSTTPRQQENNRRAHAQQNKNNCAEPERRSRWS